MYIKKQEKLSFFFILVKLYPGSGALARKPYAGYKVADNAYKLFKNQQ